LPQFVVEKSTPFLAGGKADGLLQGFLNWPLTIGKLKTVALLHCAIASSKVVFHKSLAPGRSTYIVVSATGHRSLLSW
jgi:hypothetical protein